MRIGILSDTHNDADMTRKAVEIFRQRQVDLIIHAGDIGTDDIIAMFKGIDTRFVLGNCDTDHDSIISSCRCAGLQPAARCCDFQVAGKRFFVCHGDEHSRYSEALESKKFDYLIIGHTHEFSSRHKGSTMVINPGAVTRDDHSDFLQTVAILDPETGDIEKIILS